MSRRVEAWLEHLWYAVDPGVGVRLTRAVLRPASWGFGALSALRRWAYARGLLPRHRAPVPVVSVGNLTVGGTGKTPVVAELARRLSRRGRVVAVLSRGYGGRGRGSRIVSDGTRILEDARLAGDEPRLLAEALPGVAVLAGADRLRSAELAHGRLGAAVAILDDGLQHRRLHRDLEVVVLDADRPFGNGALLPAGPLREGPAALRRADLLWATQVEGEGGGAGGGPRPFELAAAAGIPLVQSRYRPVRLRLGETCHPPEALDGQPVLALTGIARPSRFVRTLEGLGARVVGLHAHPDHHAFREVEVAAALEAARRQGARVVTTEKDAVRLPASRREEVAVLGVEVEILEGEAALEAALDRVVTAG